MRNLRSLRHDEGGHALMLLGITLPPILGIAALAVDFGSIYFNTRRLQGAADFAAIGAVQQLADAREGAVQTLAVNGYQAGAIKTLELGTYVADRATAISQRFQITADTPTAVRVTLETDVPLVLGALYGQRSVKISRQALASSYAAVAFSLGTRIAGINTSMANTMLGGALGAPVSLSVVDYNSLLAARIDMLDLVAVLQHDLTLEGHALNETLTAEVPLRDVLNSLAGVIESGGDSLNANIVRTLANTADIDKTIQLAQLLNLGRAGTNDRVPTSPVVSVPVFDLIRELALSSSSDAAIALDFTASAAGIASSTFKVSLGIRSVSTPWLTLTNSRSYVLRTSQARVMLDTSLNAASPLAHLASVRLPVVLEFGEAQAKLNSVDCSGGSDSREVAIDVAPSIGQAAIADLVNPEDFYDHTTELEFKPAAMASIPLVKVTGYSHLDFSDNAWQTLTFNEQEIVDSTVKTVHSSGTVTSLVGSLVNNLDLQASVLGFTLLAPSLKSITNNTVVAAAPAVDALLFSLTDTLGVGLGEADVRINGVTCGVPRLVG